MKILYLREKEASNKDIAIFTVPFMPLDMAKSDCASVFFLLHFYLSKRYWTWLNQPRKTIKPNGGERQQTLSENGRNCLIIKEFMSPVRLYIKRSCGCYTLRQKEKERKKKHVEIFYVWCVCVWFFALMPRITTVTSNDIEFVCKRRLMPNSLFIDSVDFFFLFTLVICSICLCCWHLFLIFASHSVWL